MSTKAREAKKKKKKRTPEPLKFTRPLAPPGRCAKQPEQRNQGLQEALGHVPAPCLVILRLGTLSIGLLSSSFVPARGVAHPSCSLLHRLPLALRCCAAPSVQPDCASSCMSPWQGTESARLVCCWGAASAVSAGPWLPRATPVLRCAVPPFLVQPPGPRFLFRLHLSSSDGRPMRSQRRS